MIPANREVLNNEDAARACGHASLQKAKRAGLFDDLPPPVNPHARRKLLWDKEQVLAYAAGKPIPDLPAQSDPDDLLDAHEAAQQWGIDEATWSGYRRTHPDLIPEGRLVYNTWHWRRGDVDSFPRPGKGAGAGRPRHDEQRQEQDLQRVAEAMIRLQGAGEAVTARSVAAETGRSEMWALPRMRKLASRDPGRFSWPGMSDQAD